MFVEQIGSEAGSKCFASIQGYARSKIAARLARSNNDSLDTIRIFRNSYPQRNSSLLRGWNSRTKLSCTFRRTCERP